MKKLLIGFTAGAILALLYAPAKGSKTRRKIAGIGNDMKEKWNDVTDCIADRIDSIRDGIDEVADKAVEKVESTQFDTGTV
jgi:gas vesicle protein